MILKWGFAVVIPYISFEGGFHFEGFQLFEIRDVSPLLAILITLCMTLSFGWIQGWIVVKSGISSFIVTLGGLFFLRGITEVSYRAFNRAPDQTAGSTTVTDLPDIKNIINEKTIPTAAIPKPALYPCAKVVPKFSIKIGSNDLFFAKNLIL